MEKDGGSREMRGRGEEGWRHKKLGTTENVTKKRRKEKERQPSGGELSGRRVTRSTGVTCPGASRCGRRVGWVRLAGMGRGKSSFPFDAVRHRPPNEFSGVVRVAPPPPRRPDTHRFRHLRQPFLLVEGLGGHGRHARPRARRGGSFHRRRAVVRSL